jgi:hypothetical protein
MANRGGEGNWQDSEVFEIENRLLQNIFACKTTDAVEASLTYARFLSKMGITPENYPVFLSMLEIENHWVIDALIGDRDPSSLFAAVQPNSYIVGRILAMMNRWNKGGIHTKNLHVILGVLQSVYSSPNEGYRIRPLSIVDINAIAKHLDKEKGQRDPLNRAILELMERISNLDAAGNAETEEVVSHAANIRDSFLDDRKKMEDVLPSKLLVGGDRYEETAPRKRRSAKGQN